MLAELIEIDKEDLMRWIGPAAGLAAALVIFLISMLVVGWRRRAAAALPPPSVGKSKTAEASADDIFTTGSKTERRNSPRRSGNPIAVYISDADAQSEPSTGYVLDRSTGGLCLSVPEEVAAGTILSVRTTNAPESIQWVQIEVKTCRPSSGEFELNCQFVRTPPWSVMLLFG